MVENADQRLDAVFAALADPTRRAILARLVGGEVAVGALAEPFAMSLAAVSKHVGILARAGLIEQVRAGRERLCRLHPQALRAAGHWIESCGLVLDTDFDRLEAWLDGLGDADPGEDWGDDTWGDPMSDDTRPAPDSA